MNDEGLEPGEATTEDAVVAKADRVVVLVSILLVFFALPHTLEDFAFGEPEAAGVPAPVLSLVVSAVFALQALGLYWLGRRTRRGLVAQLVVGLFWPVAAGFAQVPAILEAGPYRNGFSSVAYVIGVLVFGATLAVTSLRRLRVGA